MAVTKLSKAGEDFIRGRVNGSGNSKLSGSASDKKGYTKNPTAVLPYCNPLTNVSKVWTSNPVINGGITTNDELANALITWYNKYAEIYEMDANIMAAQAYQESAYIIWNYAVNSTASGISQFVAGTFYSGIIENKRGNFTDAELIALTTNMNGFTYQPGVRPIKDPFVTEYLLGRKNRPILHQNIIDNPELMIKAQFDYMKWISSRCGQLASCTLFGYSRGPYLLKNNSSYTAWIKAAQNPKRGEGYENEGIHYVYRIFKNLYDNFGYKDLDITKDAKDNFDKFNASLG